MSDKPEASDVDLDVDVTAIADRKLAWEEWKYRHDLFHKLQFRYTAVVAAVCAIPFLQPASVCTFGVSPRLYGSVALMLGLIGLTHMVMEFGRLVHLRLIERGYNKQTHAIFAKRHPVYARIVAVRFDKVMWAILFLFLVGIPAGLLVCSGSFIVCPEKA